MSDILFVAALFSGIVLLWLLAVYLDAQDNKRARHFDLAKTVGGRAGEYQDRTSGFGDQVYWQADRELEVPPDAASER